MCMCDVCASCACGEFYVDVVIIFVLSRYSCNVRSQSQELAQQYDILTEHAQYIE